MSHMPATPNPAPSGVETKTASGVATPAVSVTYVSGVATLLTLANGTSAIDGFVKTFSIRSGTGTLTCTALADGSTHVISWGGAGSFQLVWDHSSTTWRVIGTPRVAVVN